MADRRNKSTDGISRRTFLAAGSAGLIAGPLLSSVEAEPISPEPPAPSRLALRPFPRKRVHELPAELLKHVHPDAHFVRKELPPAQNGLPLLRAAIGKFTSFDDFISRPPHNVQNTFASPLFLEYRAFEKGGGWPGGQTGIVIRSWIDANQPAVKLLEEAIARGRIQFPEDHLLNFFSDMWAKKDPLENFISFLRFLKIQARISAIDGQPQRAVARVRQMLSLGRMIAESESLYIHGIKGHSAQRQALDVISEMARDGNLPDDIAADFIRNLGEMEPTPLSVKQLIRAEFCYCELTELDQLSTAPLADLIDTYILRHMYYAQDADTLKAISVSDDDLRSLRRGLHAILRDHPQPLDKAATARMAGEIVAEAIESVDLPFAHRRRERRTAVAKELAAWPAYLAPSGAPHSLSPLYKEVPIPTDQQLETARQALAKIENPLGKRITVDEDDLDTAGNVMRNQHALFSATRIILACRRKLDRDGKLPEQLEELVRDMLIDSVPLDPFDGQPFRYSRERALAWSIGSDGKDDNADWDFEAEWPTGKDLVWKLPQPKAK